MVSINQENLQANLMCIQCLVVVLTIYIVFESLLHYCRSPSHIQATAFCFQLLLVDTTRNRELYEKDQDIVLEQMV